MRHRRNYHWTMPANLNKAFSKSLKKKLQGEGTKNWESGASISFDMYHSDFSSIITLCYNRKDRDGEMVKVNYNVTIISAPSNFGKGQIYYFVCPFCARLCKILYMSYGSHYFKSQGESYNNRIYYASQFINWLDYHNEKYWRLERYKERIEKKT